MPGNACAGSSCQALDPYLIVYNRIGKSGSESLRTVISAASKIHGFVHVKPSSFNVERSPAAQRRLVDSLLNISVRRRSRVLYSGHLRWIDFSEFADPAEAAQVAYINMVRDPIRAVTSEFYWVPTRCGCNGPPARWCTPAFRARALLSCNDTLSARVLAGGHESVAHISLLHVIFLCGQLQHVGCNASIREPGRPDVRRNVRRGPTAAAHRLPLGAQVARATEIAISSTLPRFAMVGVLDLFAETLETLARVFPYFFGPPVDIARLASVYKNTNQATSALAPRELANESTLAVLMSPGSAFASEARLYNHVRQRFLCQARACGVQVSSPSDGNLRLGVGGWHPSLRG